MGLRGGEIFYMFMAIDVFLLKIGTTEKNILKLSVAAGSWKQRL